MEKDAFINFIGMKPDRIYNYIRSENLEFFNENSRTGNNCFKLTIKTGNN